MSTSAARRSIGSSSPSLDLPAGRGARSPRPLSRRPDSNRRPLHYEAPLGVEPWSCRGRRGRAMLATAPNVVGVGLRPRVSIYRAMYPSRTHGATQRPRHAPHGAPSGCVASPALARHAPRCCADSGASIASASTTAVSSSAGTCLSAVCADRAGTDAGSSSLPTVCGALSGMRASHSAGRRERRYGSAARPHDQRTTSPRC
jgi:hypothetical protein